MKKLLLLVSFSPLIFSCKKDPAAVPPPPPEPRLIALTYNAGFPDAETISLQYDAAGKIVSMQYDESGEAAQVSYPANQVLFTSKLSGHNQSVRLLVNGSGRVTRRYERFIQRDIAANETYYISDTTDYFYDSFGLLIKSEGTRHDTTRNSTDLSFVRELHTSHTITCLNTNKNLVSMSVEDKVLNVNSPVYHTNEYVFEYDQDYNNSMDFRNAVVLNEISLFQDYPFPMNKNYAKLPNKVTHTETYKDENGAPFYTNTSVYNTTVNFNETGWINQIDSDSYNKVPLTLVYQ